MITTVHSHPDVLLVLLSVLGSRSTNVADLQLRAQSGARGEKGATALGVEEDERFVAELLTQLGPSHLEASQIIVGGLP